jgi:hypothetical protein
MEFEFDPNKSVLNQEKHGIDFVEAQLLWQDLLQLELPARTKSEARYALIAKLQGKIWTAIFTRRNQYICLISVRRARKIEEAAYYDNQN